jgi:hypothetical protein
VATRSPIHLVGIMRIHMMYSTRCVLLFSVILPAFGTTSILSIDATQTQAKITVQTDQTGFCTYRASRGATFSTNVPDLVDNSNTDARTGSIVNPGAHVFILGAHKSNDALAAAATYWIGVTCGADSEVSRVFQTRPIQWGNTAPDVLPFNPAKFGNMDHPVIDWNGTAPATAFCDPLSHSYCDPNTGVEYWPVSKPGWISPSYSPFANFGAWAQTPIQLTGSTWTNATKVSYHAPSPSVYATATGTDKLFIPISQFNCGNGQSLTGFGGGCTLDDVNFTLWCGNATTGGVSGFNMQLTVDGGQHLIGNATTSANCPTGSPVQQGVYPQVSPSPIFADWGVIPQRNLINPPTGTVSVSGTTVTLTTSSPGFGNYFNLDWKTGTPILINGSYAHLAAPPTSSTTLTTVENLGTLTNVAYSGANFGVVIWKTNASSASVDVTITMNYAYSSPIYQGSNGDGEIVNLASVSVSKSADGATCGIYTVGCSAGVLSPPVTGYIGTIFTGGGASSVFLWIPRNSDGSPRGETRLLSIFNKPSGSARVNGNGDTLGALSLATGSFGALFDDSNGNALYTTDQSGTRAWKLTYNEAYTGCAGYVAYKPYPASGNYANTYNGNTLTDDCFQYTVMTPLAGGKDIATQVKGTAGNNGGYQTGLNYRSQSVGTAHTGFDLGWMTNVSLQQVVGSYLIAQFSAQQNHLSVVAAFADDVSGNGTYVLKGVWNTWDSGGTRWGGAHSCPYFHMGTYEFCVLDPLVDTGSNVPFPNANKTLVSQVNRAGFGSTPAWDSNTSLSASTDYYTCPTALAAPYASFSSTVNCVQIRVHDPFCQFTPNATYTFPDGKQEAAEFPCVTPGFGVSNSSYSKLQDIQVGDYLQDYAHGGEKFVVLTAPSYNALNDITFWVLRTAGYSYVYPTYGSNNGDDTQAQGHTSGCTNCVHTNGWLLMTMPYGAGNSATIDISSPSNTWLYDNPTRGSAHAVGGPGSLPGTYSFSQAACGPQFSLYCGTSNLSPAASVNIPFANSATGNPSFAGVGNIGNFNTQSYQNATYSQGVLPLPVFADVKALLPGGPASPESANIYGNTFTTTLVSGASHTYLISSDCCVTSPDYKRQGLQGYAGRFWMKDVSSPTTFGSVADLPNWSVCVVRNVNECVFGSTVGQYYLSSSQLDIKTQCWSANFGNSVPCLSAFGAVIGQAYQFRNDRPDLVGVNYRKFGFMHSHIGSHYGFTNCRFTPDGQFEMCPGYWMDGVRTDWIAMRTGPLAPVDSVNRTNFVPIILTYQGAPFASFVRARFGYAENGGDLLQCTPYGQDCSTEIPSGSATDPFSFTNEAVTRQACANGASCTITIPSLPNRILYYVVDRLDSSGNVLQTSPMQAVAVP